MKHFLLGFFLGLPLLSICQTSNPPLEKDLYNRHTRVHSSLRPLLFTDSLLRRSENSLSLITIDSAEKSWLSRKLFSEHLIDVKKDDYTAFVDFLPDFLIGKTEGRTTWLNTRGYQAGGTVGKNFFFYTSGFENQAKFADYYHTYVETTKVVPGQSYDRNRNKPLIVKDWSYATALISYTPVKYLNITVGQDKNFIGDGYRSMILSDFSSNYPFIRLTGTLGNVQYMAMWAAMQDPNAKQLSYDVGYRKKGGVFHYLDWNVNNRLSFGFFDAVIWAQYDELGNKRGFDWGYANPIIFLRTQEAFSGSPDNAILGFTGKYEIFNKSALYGQFMLDEFRAKDFFSGKGDYRNKWGGQVGLRGAGLFNVERLNYLIEHNRATPYTYSGRNTILSYSQYSEPLAHPYGANFKETVGILSYGWGKFTVSTKLNAAVYGLDPVENTNYGKNIVEPYTGATLQENNYIGQGLKTDLVFSETRLSYLLNPKTNLRLELGGIYRNEKNSVQANSTKWLTFGLRSSFRNLYQDF